MNEEEEFDQEEFERLMSDRGRSRSRSFLGSEAQNDTSENEKKEQENEKNEQEKEKKEQEAVAKQASQLTKAYLAGAEPFDPNKHVVGGSSLNANSSSANGSSTNSSNKLPSTTLTALSEGLHESKKVSRGEEQFSYCSEEEKEEQRMVEEEKKFSCSPHQSHQTKPDKSSDPSTAHQTDRLTQNSKANNLTSLKKNMFSTFKNRLSFPKISKKTPTPPPTTSTPTNKPPPPPTQKKKHKLKLLLLGDSGVGKSSLIRVFSGDDFSESMLATAGVDFKLRNMLIENEYEVALQVWDTAGQERFHRITATYYKGANGIILVYDVNEKQGFENVGYWMNNIQQYTNVAAMPAMLLVGNKIDLPNRVVPLEDGMKAAEQYHCRFMETSAKTAENTESALETIARDALFLSLNAGLTQKELIEKESLYDSRSRKENCSIC